MERMLRICHLWGIPVLPFKVKLTLHILHTSHSGTCDCSDCIVFQESILFLKDSKHTQTPRLCPCSSSCLSFLVQILVSSETFPENFCKTVSPLLSHAYFLPMELTINWPIISLTDVTGLSFYPVHWHLGMGWFAWFLLRCFPSARVLSSTEWSHTIYLLN